MVLKRNNYLCKEEMDKELKNRKRLKQSNDNKQFIIYFKKMKNQIKNIYK